MANAMTDSSSAVPVVDAHSTLGALVTARPDLAPVLDGLGLDFCCHGHHTIEQACVDVGRDLGGVLAALAAATAVPPLPSDWTSLGPAALIDHIVSSHHAFLRREAPRVSMLGRKVLAAHGDNHPELGAIIATFAQLWSVLEPHLDEEEADLFARVQRGAAIEASDVLALIDDHEAVGGLLDRLRELTVRFTAPDDGCVTFEAFYRGLDRIDNDTRLHVHKENNMLFPAITESGAAR